MRVTVDLRLLKAARDRGSPLPIAALMDDEGILTPLGADLVGQVEDLARTDHDDHDDGAPSTLDLLLQKLSPIREMLRDVIGGAA